MGSVTEAAKIETVEIERLKLRALALLARESPSVRVPTPRDGEPWEDFTRREEEEFNLVVWALRESSPGIVCECGERFGPGEAGVAAAEKHAAAFPRHIPLHAMGF
jgi:hypothetical protein